jgi:hypothetical protein
LENFHPTWMWCLWLNMVVTRLHTKRMEHLTLTTTTIWWCLLISICLQHEFYPSIELSIVVKKTFVLKNLETFSLNVFPTLPFFVEFKCIRWVFLKSFKNCNSQFYTHLFSHKVSKWVSFKILKVICGLTSFLKIQVIFKK